MFGKMEMTAVAFMFGCFWQGLIWTYASWMPGEVLFLSFMSVLFFAIGFIYNCYIIVVNRCRVLIETCPPDKLIWHRYTKDGLYLPEWADKGAFGVTKSKMYNHNSIVINKGDFPVRTVNGNQGIIVYDHLATNVNLRRCVAWQKIFRKHKVRSGKEAYMKAEKDGQTYKDKKEATVG